VKDKLLIIEVHSDDSAISIGGFLEKFKNKYEYHFALLVCSDIRLHHSGLLTKEERTKEYEQYVKYFNGVWHSTDQTPYDADALMDTIPKREIVASLEKIIGAVKPQIMICQGPSFHHDHSIVYEAAIAATRPTAMHCPGEIYITENPTYVHSLGPQTDFKPDFYVSLTEEEMQGKVDCFKKYFPSQIRESANYLSEDGIRSWARYRGIEARCKYAEAFRTFRRVV
jgi:LmbE family N-acetylglucosaminyl deacetylase